MSVTCHSIDKDGKHKVSKFDKLAGSVEKEYEKKGMKPKQAKLVGEKVAGKVAAEKGK